MKFLYFSKTGRNDPTGASVPIHLAVNGSVEAGHETTIMLGGDAVDLILGDAEQTVEGLGLPPLRELWAKVRDVGVPVYI